MVKGATLPASILLILAYVFTAYFLHRKVSTFLFPENTLDVVTADEKPSEYFSVLDGNNVHYEIITTDYGWTTTDDLNFSRRIVTGEFWNATLQHPRYNASAKWSDLNAYPVDPSRLLIVFLDVDTCLECLYPTYITESHKQMYVTNAETSGGRAPGGYMDPLRQSCGYIHRAATSPALHANPASRLIVLNCFGWQRHDLKRLCPRIYNASFAETVNEHPQVIFASYSETKTRAKIYGDVGLAAPAIKPVILSGNERLKIQQCKTSSPQRRYLFSFQGQGGHGRDHLLKIQNETDVFVRIADRSKYRQDLQQPKLDTWNFRDLILNSTFGGAPRGDNLYSYRLAETMSAGTIPVVYADDWLPPFGLNWNDFSVFIPERQMANTANVLRAIPTERVCRMQQLVVQIWDRYLASRGGWVRGLVEAALAQSNLTVVA